MAKTRTARPLPAATFTSRLLSALQATAITRRLTRRLLQHRLRNRVVTMATGIGAGLRFNAGYSNPAYGLGTNELPVQQWLAATLRLGDVFYDVGANVGFLSVIAARLVADTGHVYAFEPVPENATLVHQNAAHNDFDQISVVAKAVAEHSGEAQLLLAHYSGGSALAVVDTPPPDLKNVVAVDVISIDEFIATGAAPPTVVKIDVEGAEIHVLRGMAITLGQIRPFVLYEIDDGNREDFDHKAAQCASFLRHHGYTITPLAASYPDIDWHVGHFVAAPAT